MQFRISLVEAPETKFAKENCTRVGDFLWIFEGDNERWEESGDWFNIIQENGVTDGGYAEMNHLEILADVVKSFEITFVEVRDEMQNHDRIVDNAVELETTLNTVDWMQ